MVVFKKCNLLGELRWDVRLLVYVWCGGFNCLSLKKIIGGYVFVWVNCFIF